MLVDCLLLQPEEKKGTWYRLMAAREGGRRGKVSQCVERGGSCCQWPHLWWCASRASCISIPSCRRAPGRFQIQYQHGAGEASRRRSPTPISEAPSRPGGQTGGGGCGGLSWRDNNEATRGAERSGSQRGGMRVGEATEAPKVGSRRFHQWVKCDSQKSLGR